MNSLTWPSLAHCPTMVSGRCGSTGCLTCVVRGVAAYNFSQLDTFLDHLHRHQLQPGFELMGNPGKIFSDFENVTQVLWWKQLVAETACRYIDRYGLSWVASWRWESWNEPDHHDFDNLNFTVQGFLNYYDACRAGLDAAGPGLQLGGPGASCRGPGYSRICWALLHHCDRGTSIFPPHHRPTLNFISIHKKGQEEADSILTQEMATLHLIRANFPNLRHVPIINDEGDFLKGWWRGRGWRAGSGYAALVARAVASHLPVVTHLNYNLLSFDNAFLNYLPSVFEQRTLLARFQINSSLEHQVQLVKKPSYAIMGLLSLLGDHQLHHTTTLLPATSAPHPATIAHPPHNLLSVISSCRGCASDGGTRGYSLDPQQTNTIKTAVHKMDHRQQLGEHPSPFFPSPSTAGGREGQDTHDKQQDVTSMREDNEPVETDVLTMGKSEEQNTKLKRYKSVVVGQSSSVEEEEKGVENCVGVEGCGGRQAHWETSVLLSLTNASASTHKTALRVSVIVTVPRTLVGVELWLADYQLGGRKPGPCETWAALGRPVEPTPPQLASIRAAQGPRRTTPHSLVPLSPHLPLWLKLRVPEVRVIHLCQPFSSAPGQVVGVRTLGVTSADVLVTWSDENISTRCVRQYEVEQSVAGPGGPYRQISGAGLTDNNFWFSRLAGGGGGVGGWYRVRVVTYWGTVGQYSQPVHHHP